MKTRQHPLLPLFRIASTSLLAASFAQAFDINVSDTRPNAGTNRTLSTDNGNVEAPAVLPTTTYTLTNLDLTSIGGGAAEEIVFTVAFTQTGGTGVAYNGFGNIYVTGGSVANQINPGDALTADAALVSTTFAGGIGSFSIGFTGIQIGGYGANDVAEVTHDGGTIEKDYSSDTNANVAFVPSSAFTLATTSSLDGVNLQKLIVKIATPAVDASWTGASDDSWIVDGNWDPAGVPAPGDSVTFDGGSNANLATALNADFELAGLTVTSPTGAVSIGGANSLTIDIGGIDLSAATQDLTIAAPVILGAAQSWNVAGGQSLAANGGISGAFALSIGGAGNVSLGAAIDPSVPLTVASNGTLKMGASSVLASTATPTVNGTLDLNGTSQSVEAINGNGTIDNTAAGTSELTVGNNDVGFTLSANLQDTDGTLALVKTGTGQLIVSSGQSHSGGTSINGGSLRVTANSSIGSGPVMVSGGTFDSYYNSFSFGNDLTLGAGGELQTSGGNNNTLTWSGPVELTGDATLDANGGTSGITISGNVTNNGHTLTANAGGGSVGHFISGAISGTGGNLLVTNGLLEISSPSNAYTGTTTVSAGILRLGASDVLPDATNVIIGNGVLNAFNHTDTAGTLEVTGTATINLGAGAGGTLAFTESSALTWTGTLNITGTFTSGASLRFGTDANGLSSTQLAAITVAGSGSYTLNSSGYLIEATGGSPYDTWATQIPNAAERDRTDDPDGDGFDNEQEFLFGTSPIIGNGSLVSTAAAGGDLVLRWLQRESAASYTLTESSTLEAGSWSTVVSPLPALDGDQSGAPTDYDYYTVTLPTGGGKMFYRIEGTED